MKRFFNILLLCALICTVLSCKKDEDEYLLDVQNSPLIGGIVTKSPNMNVYQSGTSVTLTASPNSDYQFSKWEGDITGTSNPISVTIDENKNITAVFTQNTYALTILNSPSNGGSVAKSPNQNQYASGTMVTLTATPSTGYQFSKWEGDVKTTSNPVTVTMNGNMNVTAVFTESPNPIITLSETNLTFIATSGETDPSPIDISITNGGTGTLNGLSTTFPDGKPTWMHVSLNQSTAPAVFHISPSIWNPFGGSFPPGTYTTRIAISSENASNSPQYINVTFIIEEAEAPSSITVYASYDNGVMYSSMVDNTANTVFSNSEIGVGVDYYWNALSFDIVITASALKFDVQSQIEGRSIESAILRLNVLSLRGDFSITPQINVSAIATNWNPNTLTSNYWNDNLRFYNNGQVNVNAPSNRVLPLDIDVTSIVKYWASGTFNNYGLALRPENHTYPNTYSYQTTYFQSIDVGFYDSSEKRPQLIIHFD